MRRIRRRLKKEKEPQTAKADKTPKKPKETEPKKKLAQKEVLSTRMESFIVQGIKERARVDGVSLASLLKVIILQYLQNPK